MRIERESLVIIVILIAVSLLGVPVATAEPRADQEQGLLKLRAEEAALQARLEEVRAMIKELEAAASAGPASEVEWPFLTKIVGSTFEVSGGAYAREGPSTDSKEIDYLGYSDAVTILSYGSNGWWRVRIVCKHSQESPCNAEAYVHHSALDGPFRRIGAEVPKEFLYPEAEAARQIKLDKMAQLAPHYYAEATWQIKDSDSGTWDLLGAVGEGGLAEYKVKRGDVVGWVASYYLAQPKSYDLEPYQYALHKRYEAAEAAIRAEYPNLLVHHVSPSLHNSAGGVDVHVALEVTNEKTVKYISLEVTPFNAVGDRVSSTGPTNPIGRLRYTGPIGKADGLESATWENVWYNPTIACVRVDQIRVEYMDGSNFTYIRDLPLILHPDYSNRCSAKKAG
jgi:Bacterial SH3 domain